MEFRARVRQTLIDLEVREQRFLQQNKEQAKALELDRLKEAWEIKVSPQFPALKSWLFERKATLMAGLLVSDDSMAMIKAKERILEIEEILEEIDMYGNSYIEKMQELLAESGIGREVGDTELDAEKEE